jgi:hypothetical protein
VNRPNKEKGTEKLKKIISKNRFNNIIILKQRIIKRDNLFLNTLIELFHSIQFTNMQFLQFGSELLNKNCNVTIHKCVGIAQFHNYFTKEIKAGRM